MKLINIYLSMGKRIRLLINTFLSEFIRSFICIIAKPCLNVIYQIISIASYYVTKVYEFFYSFLHLLFDLCLYVRLIFFHFIKELLIDHILFIYLKKIQKEFYDYQK